MERICSSHRHRSGAGDLGVGRFTRSSASIGPDRQGLRAWLEESGFLRAGRSKPVKPKEAWKQALRLRKKPRSSALFQDLAGTITLAGCVDSAFGKLKAT